MANDSGWSADHEQYAGHYSEHSELMGEVVGDMLRTRWPIVVRVGRCQARVQHREETRSVHNVVQRLHGPMMPTTTFVYQLVDIFAHKALSPSPFNIATI